MRGLRDGPDARRCMRHSCYGSHGCGRGGWRRARLSSRSSWHSSLILAAFMFPPGRDPRGVCGEIGSQAGKDHRRFGRYAASGRDSRPEAERVCARRPLAPFPGHRLESAVAGRARHALSHVTSSWGGSNPRTGMLHSVFSFSETLADVLEFALFRGGDRPVMAASVSR